MINKKSIFTNLCIKEFSGNISNSEKEILHKYLDTSLNYKSEYEKLKDIWDGLKPSENFNFINTETEWNKIEEILIEERTSEPESGNLSRLISFIQSPKLRPAFITALIIIVSLLSFIIFSGQPGTDYSLETVSTKKGERIELLLPDGSTVKLNCGSRISYFKPFKDNQRNVTLEGEAYFDVNKDESPFTISTLNAQAIVLGTKFNVWARDDETRVVVKEGRVGLRVKNIENEKVIINPGEMSLVSKNNLPDNPLRVNAEYLTSWVDGFLVFENTTLTEINGEISRFYNKEITTENIITDDYRLTGAFNDRNIDSVLSKICLALNLNYSKNDNRYLISK